MFEKIWDTTTLEINAVNILGEAIKDNFMNQSFDDIDEAEAYLAMKDAVSYYVSVMIKKKEISLINAIKVIEVIAGILDSNFNHFAYQKKGGGDFPILLNDARKIEVPRAE